MTLTCKDHPYRTAGWGPVTAEPATSYGQLEGESRTSEILGMRRAGVDSPPYRVSYLRCRKCQAHVGRSTLGRYANTALGRLWEAYLINVYRMPRLREVGHFGIKKKKMQTTMTQD